MTYDVRFISHRGKILPKAVMQQEWEAHNDLV